ncbi:hypothetical protein DPMN_028769 [Dreissena polymorpha]|uniref:Uncharacterized protein n=1 Tax=Dreissena polymorpha TaxID=45954 RepID=A0A9D4REN1_DREPO|nr:hypothetical protein DPMN_028769 [Dreissena polymorpha]
MAMTISVDPDETPHDTAYNSFKEWGRAGFVYIEVRGSIYLPGVQAGFMLDEGRDINRDVVSLDDTGVPIERLDEMVP